MFWNDRRFKFWLSHISLGLAIVNWLITFALFICGIATDAPGNEFRAAVIGGAGVALGILVPLLLGIIFFLTFKMNYIMTVSDYVSLQDKALNYGLITMENRNQTVDAAVNNFIKKETTKKQQETKLAETEKRIQKLEEFSKKIRRGGPNESQVNA